MKLAHYQCCQCFHEFTGPPGPITCPNCNFIYVKWTNYDTDFGRGQSRDTSPDVSDNRETLQGKLGELGEQIQQVLKLEGTG